MESRTKANALGWSFWYASSVITQYIHLASLEGALLQVIEGALWPNLGSSGMRKHGHYHCLNEYTTPITVDAVRS